MMNDFYYYNILIANKICNKFKVKWWITFNEPRLIRTGYGDTNYAPGLGDHGVSDYIAAHNVLRTHGKVYHLYNQTYKPTQQGTNNNSSLVIT